MGGTHPQGACDKENCPRNPHGADYTLNLIHSAGYATEAHSVTTADKYILSIQRILGKLGEKPPTGPRPVVFLQHGLTDSAPTYIMMGENSLSIRLAAAGYDVWLGNIRGSTFSRCHEEHDADLAGAYWDFTWDEMAKYDLPAMINYVLGVTHQKQLYYIGHSQGTSIAFAGFSSNQDLASKIKAFLALAPVGTIADLKGGMQAMATSEAALTLLAALGGREIANCTKVTSTVGPLAAYMPTLTNEALFDFAGPDDLGEEYPLAEAMKYYPAGTSARNLLHWLNMYGDTEMRSYDKKTVYDMTQLRAKVLLFYGANDYLATLEDVTRNLIGKLPNLVYQKKYVGWNHIDFVWGIKLSPEAYNDILEQLALLEASS